MYTAKLWLALQWNEHPTNLNKSIILALKGGYLDFSLFIKLKNIYVTEIYMKKQYKSSIN